jgi:hypothetical protein
MTAMGCSQPFEVIDWVTASVLCVMSTAPIFYVIDSPDFLNLYLDSITPFTPSVVNHINRYYYEQRHQVRALDRITA